MWCARFRIVFGSTDKVDGMFTCSYRNAASVLATANEKIRKTSNFLIELRDVTISASR